MVVSTAVSQFLARWAHLYGHTPVRATVTYLHLVGILVGGGVAVAADRASLRLLPTTPDWSEELARLASVHRWVVTGLALIFANGLLMAPVEVSEIVGFPNTAPRSKKASAPHPWSQGCRSRGPCGGSRPGISPQPSTCRPD